jgi:hypothetical protein
MHSRRTPRLSSGCAQEEALLASLTQHCRDIDK